MKRVFGDTVRRNRIGLTAAATAILCMAAITVLYDLPAEPFGYAAVLILILSAVLFSADALSQRKKAKTRERMIQTVLTEDTLPLAETLAEQDYQEALRIVRNELNAVKNQYETQHREETDYFTAWVHQIKTPIAVMRMELDGTAETDRALENELFRIEQYVEMVLKYLRLGEGVSDLVIREYPLDELIRETVRKFAPQFVAKKLRLVYEGTEKRIITDKKWFSGILEQLLSNAIKYTPAGSITVSVQDGCLHVADTGIGIAPEDVPRVFEKGFTGENGRWEKRSSGLGLYLAKKSADLLRIPLTAAGTVGQGSTFSLHLEGKLID